MSTPPEPGSSPGGPVLEPARVLRRRRSDNLAALMREPRRDSSVFESVPVPRPIFGSEAETQELPPVPSELRPLPTTTGPFGPGLRRAAIVVGVSAAALVGFACALLLPGKGEASTSQPVSTPTPVTSAPATTAGTADPDGAGTLREGDSGPEVKELEQRLLRIPNVYENGSTSGQYDATLTAAVARFQLWYGIRGDENGVYGDDTRKDLESRTALDNGQ